MSLRARPLLLVAGRRWCPDLLGVRFFQNRAAEIEQALAALSMQANNIANDLDEKIQGTAQLQYGLGRAVDLDSAKQEQCSPFSGARTVPAVHRDPEHAASLAKHVYPDAEEAGQIIALGAACEACREAASRPQPPAIAVNVSPI